MWACKLCVYYYTVDRPWYTWIHCIHAGTPRGYYMLYHYTVDRPGYTWIHSIHARGCYVLGTNEPSMVYVDTLYLLYVGMHTKGLLCVYHYTLDCPWYTWIHCIHAGTPKGYYMYTITQWTVQGIHGYILSMQANQGAVMY